MSLFNILSSEGARDPWNPNSHTNSSSIFHSQQQGSLPNQQNQQQSSQNQPSQQQPFRRISVSGSPNAVQLGSMALSAQSIDEDSPLSTFQSPSGGRGLGFDSDTTFGLTSNNKSASTTSLNSSLSNSLVLNGSGSGAGILGGNSSSGGNPNTLAGSNNNNGNSSSGNININGNSNSINSGAGGGMGSNSLNNISFMQTPYNIGSVQQQPYTEQRRFTWANNSLSIDPNAGASMANPSAATPTTNNNLNGGPFTFSPILSSIPKYRDQLPIMQSQQQGPSHQTPIHPSTALNDNFLSNQLSSPSSNIQALMKQLDETVYKLKAGFRLLEQENEQLKLQLKQNRKDSVDVLFDSNVDLAGKSTLTPNRSYATGTSGSQPVSETLQLDGQSSLGEKPTSITSPPTAAAVLTGASSTVSNSGTTRPGTIGSKPVISSGPRTTDLAKQSVPGSTSTSSGSVPIGSKTPKILKKENPSVNSAASSPRFASTFIDNNKGSKAPYTSGPEQSKPETSYNSGSHGGSYHGGIRNNNSHHYNSGMRSPPEPATLEAVVYGVEKSLSMEQIRDDLEGNDIFLACTPRPLMRNDKNSTLPVHSVVITLLDDDTYRQCIEHSLPINYSMHRVKALRTFPRKKGLPMSIPSGAPGVGGELKSRRTSSHSGSKPQDSNSANTSFSYSDDEEQSEEY